ncbi:MAG: helix-turn-helix domain-containing protein [archaeon]|nr:helix-turn-helix domain-containing protein [archaeon]
METYNKFYLESAKNVLGHAVEYIINDKGMSPEDFTRMFVSSGYAKLFGYGDPRVVCGLTGIGLAAKMLCATGHEVDENIGLIYRGNLSEEYWAGWALAHYQWYCGRRFDSILNKIPLSEIIRMYHPFHEMDISHFISTMEHRYHDPARETNLKIHRKLGGLSQSELADRSGVNLHMIQLYEQRKSNIDKAQAYTLARLAAALRCPMEDLMEDPLHAGEMKLDWDTINQ